jgi:hypothetical protein
MRLLILLFLILINLNFLNKPAFANACDEVSVEWNLWAKKNYASFKFKSKSSRTVKIYDLSLKTSSDVVIKELGEDFYIAPFNIVEREFYIGNLNIDTIKTASRRCAYEEKKTGTKYVNSVKWKQNSTMAYNDCGIIGVSCDGWLDVSASRNSASIGDKISVYNKKGKIIETFEVKKIYLDYDRNQCWVSKLNKEKFKDYLSIQNCTGN